MAAEPAHVASDRIPPAKPSAARPDRADAHGKHEECGYSAAVCRPLAAIRPMSSASSVYSRTARPFGLSPAPSLLVTVDLKPSFWASRRRSEAWTTGRTPPASEISPKYTASGGSGELESEEISAAATARSAAGSLTFNPPAT